MNSEEKTKIIHMRQAGIKMSEIASTLDISVNTVKSFCRRNAEQISGQMICDTAESSTADSDHCKECGIRLKRSLKGKPKKFCSERCRRIWWKENNGCNPNRKAFYRQVCAGCGKEFESYGNSKRTFCSHGCYIKKRFRGE